MSELTEMISSFKWIFAGEFEYNSTYFLTLFSTEIDMWHIICCMKYNLYNTIISYWECSSHFKFQKSALPKNHDCKVTLCQPNETLFKKPELDTGTDSESVFDTGDAAMHIWIWLLMILRLLSSQTRLSVQNAEKV